MERSRCTARFPHWNWEDTGKDSIHVWVYSNFDEVELFLNGTSLGKQQMPKYKHVEWMVKYQSGELVGKAYRNGKVAKEQVVKTAGDPQIIKIEPHKESLLANEQDVISFDISILDKNQVFCPNAEKLLTFTLSGPARMLGVGNGSPISHETDKLPMRRTFHGKAAVIIQSTNEPGEMVLTVSSPGLKEVSYTIKSIAPDKVMPRFPSKITEVELMKFYPKSEKSGDSAKVSKGPQSLEEMYMETAGYSMDKVK